MERSIEQITPKFAADEMIGLRRTMDILDFYYSYCMSNLGLTHVEVFRKCVTKYGATELFEAFNMNK